MEPTKIASKAARALNCAPSAIVAVENLGRFAFIGFVNNAIAAEACI
jgi:hypothetical protein